jgi:hypothetical protein
MAKPNAGAKSNAGSKSSVSTPPAKLGSNTRPGPKQGTKVAKDNK